jgi:ATP-dependent Lon protease
MPGRLIDILIDSKTMNPIVLVDELDKVSETHHGKEIIGTLIHLTDSTSNNKYNHDKYFSGIEFDLSKVLFVFTYNDASKIDRILADRLIKINVDNYNFKEKLEITNKHIIPYLLDKFKFNQNDITFNQDALEYIVRDSKKETGMRDIKTKIKIIISRINNLLLTNETDNIIKLKYKKLYPNYKSLPVIVPKEHIETLLDESISDSDKNDRPPEHMYI